MSINKYFENKVRKCFLKSMDENFKDIELQEGENLIGRSRSTLISDTFCSKNQLTLTLNSNKCTVDILVNGANASGLNGFMIEKSKSINAAHGDIIEVLYGKYRYKIEFQPAPKVEETSDENKLESNREMKNQWERIDNDKLIVFTSENSKPSEKIAGYDLDWTIIKTKSGNVFPKDTDDWEVMLPEIPKKLKLLIADGFKICFFTNQSGISRGKIRLDDFKRRIESIRLKLNIPLQVFIATGDGVYRKPLPGMWNYLAEHENDSISICKEKSFYVGDAAGRPEVKLPVKRKRDHSSVDRLFAYNIGISFFTPEEHFQSKKKCDWVAPEYDPKSLKTSLSLYEPNTTKVPSDNCEVIIMVGLPGSGKSSFSNEYLKPVGYKILNADTLGSVQKCLSECEDSIKSKQSCVIDNTNLDVEARKKFINVAKRNKVDCRCFAMNATLSQIKHNLAFRLLTDKTHAKINDMIFNSMKKKYAEPKIAEGFSEIVKVNLVDGVLKDKNEIDLYKMYLVEK